MTPPRPVSRYLKDKKAKKNFKILGPQTLLSRKRDATNKYTYT